MQRIFVVLIILALLAGCAGQTQKPPKQPGPGSASLLAAPAARPIDGPQEPPSSQGSNPSREPPTPLAAQAGATPPQTSLDTAARPETENSSSVRIEPTGAPRPTLAPGAWKELPVIPTVSETARQVYQHGLEMGNQPHVFSKVGDCQNVDAMFLAFYDAPPRYYSLGEYAYLQETIDWFSGSFKRESLAVKGGFNGAALMSPLRADPKHCQKGEFPLACELRENKPSIALISMETWWSKKPAEVYEKYMRQVIEYSLAQGVVPILATKADNLEGDESINATIAKLAYEYDLPLWNFWRAVQPLPNHGLSADGFHLTFAGNFFDDPEKMQFAWPVRNLTALQALDAAWRGLTGRLPAAP